MIYSEEDMKVAANFILEFAQPEKGALKYLSHAISHNYLESMPVYKNTLLRDGMFVLLQNKKLSTMVIYNSELIRKRNNHML